MGRAGSQKAYRHAGRSLKKLIRAVVGCVDGDELPPAPLSLAWQCERWRTLPDDGNLYGQDYQTITQMTACANIYWALSRLRNMRGKQIHDLTEAERKILGQLVKMGLLFNG